MNNNAAPSILWDRILQKYDILHKKDIRTIILLWPQQQILNKSTIDAIEEKGHRIMC